MSVLGPISTMQAARPATYLDLDFSNGDTPGNLVYSRASGHGVWDKDGKYSVVGPNVPPITWVPELNSYALALEPGDRLRNVLNPNDSGWLRRTLGYDIAPATDIPAIQESAVFVDAPDGSMTALRVNGKRTAGQGPVISFQTSTTYARAKFFIRKGLGLGERVVPIFFRNSTTATNFPIVTLDLGSGELGTIPDTSNQYFRVTRRCRDWLEVDAVRGGFSPGDVVAFYIHGSSARDIRADYWRLNLSSNPVISSFIQPGISYTERAAYSGITPIVMPTEAGAQFDWFVEGVIDAHPWAIPNGVIPWGIRNVGGGNRVDVIWSTSASHSIRHADAQGLSRTFVSANDVALSKGGRRFVRCTARSANNRAYGSPSGANVLSLETYADMANAPALAGHAIGAYGKENGAAYLKRSAIFPAGTLDDLKTASMR
ncbi:hypothetical protein [Kerstersia similis]|uniref:hypothetical protein n=1 Tax=Kerstersia similis TaxID=206505 RepID=UPI0039EFAA51